MHISIKMPNIAFALLYITENKFTKYTKTEAYVTYCHTSKRTTERRHHAVVAQSKRKLVARAKGFPIEVLYLRDDDIPQAVHMGVADVGIVGLNEVAERNMAVDEVMRLGFGACRISLAVPREVDYPGLSWFNGRTVATSYPTVLRKFFAQEGIEADIHEIAGSVEIAPAVGMADAIFDIVSSGGTLVQNGLREVEEVFYSEAALVAHQGLDDEKLAEIEKLKFRFSSIVNSRGYKYVLMNL